MSVFLPVSQVGMSPKERLILGALWPFGRVIPEAHLVAIANTTPRGLRERLSRLRVNLRPQGWTIACSKREGWAICRLADAP